MEEKRTIGPMFEELTEQDAAALKELLTRFVKSYSRKTPSVSDQEWLT